MPHVEQWNSELNLLEEIMEFLCSMCLYEDIMEHGFNGRYLMELPRLFVLE